MKKILLAATLPLALCACASMSSVAYDDDDSLDGPDTTVVPGKAFRPASSFSSAAGLPSGMTDARVYMDQEEPNIQQLLAPRTLYYPR